MVTSMDPRSLPLSPTSEEEFYQEHTHTHTHTAARPKARVEDEHQQRC